MYLRVSSYLRIYIKHERPVPRFTAPLGQVVSSTALAPHSPVLRFRHNCIHMRISNPLRPSTKVSLHFPSCLEYPDPSKARSTHYRNLLSWLLFLAHQLIFSPKATIFLYYVPMTLFLFAFAYYLLSRFATWRPKHLPLWLP